MRLGLGMALEWTQGSGEAADAQYARAEALCRDACATTQLFKALAIPSLEAAS